MRVGKSSLCSKRLMVAPPLFPPSRAFQVEATSLPTGETTPSPVITTRRPSFPLIRSLPAPCSSARAVLLQVRNGVADRAHLLGVLVRDVDAELFLERHHELDRVQRVRAQILDEGG